MIGVVTHPIGSAPCRLFVRERCAIRQLRRHIDIDETVPVAEGICEGLLREDRPVIALQVDVFSPAFNAPGYVLGRIFRFPLLIALSNAGYASKKLDLIITGILNA